MPTILRTLPTVHPDAAALSPILVPSDTELALFQNALVKNWWRAADGLDSTGWRCRKTDAKLIPARTAMPTLQKRAGIVRSIAVNAPGAGYTSAPNVVIDAPPAGGIQAAAIAAINAGGVVSITMTDEGSGYVGVPGVALTGGGGAGATATATYSATSFYNGMETLKFASGSANGELYDGGLNLFPTNSDFGVVLVCRPGPNNDQGYIFGTGGNPDLATGAFGIQLGTGTSFNSYAARISAQSTVNLGNTPAVPLKYESGPVVLINSFDDKGGAAGEGNFIVSPGNASFSITNATAHVTNGELHIGGAGAIGSTPSALNVIEGGDIAEIIVTTVPLHLVANATLLSQIRSYLGARYNIVTP